MSGRPIRIARLTRSVGKTCPVSMPPALAQRAMPIASAIARRSAMQKRQAAALGMTFGHTAGRGSRASSRMAARIALLGSGSTDSTALYKNRSCRSSGTLRIVST